MKWQPIETAPKDGTPVILFIDGSVIEGSWDDQTHDDGSAYGPGRWMLVKLESHGCGCCADDDPPPTHWMPLPAAPEEPS